MADRVPCGACVILSSSNDMLMIRRTGSHGEGKWSFPGGWCEPGEDPSQTAVREAREEVGLEVSRIFFLGYTFDRHPEGFDAITLWFYGGADGSPRIAEPEKITEIAWWSAKRLRAEPPGNLFLPVRNGIEKGLIPVG